jgi:hypothetical protein
LRERDHWGDPGVYGRIILRRNFRKWARGGMDWNELVQERDTGECGNEPSGTIKCGEFLD